MKRTLQTIGALSALSLPLQSAITMNVPAYGSTDVGLRADAINDNRGAIYKSGKLNIFEDLAAQLYARPQNQSAYASMNDLIADWNFSIDTNGEVARLEYD